MFCILCLTQLLNAPKIVTLKHYQQCLPHPLKVGENCKYKKILKEKLLILQGSKEFDSNLVDSDDELNDFLAPMEISQN